MIEILNDYGFRVKDFLANYLDSIGKELDLINRWGLDVSTRLKNYSVNGKMIRGSLVLFSSIIAGREIDDDSLRVASAVELFHSGLLVHDDIMDCDDLRRGNPSLHYQYRKEGMAENMPDSGQYGISMGICAGDIGFFIGFELISKLKAEKDRKDKILQLFSREFISVGLGQMQDIYFGESSVEPDEKDIINVYLYKTARYTFSLPFMLGGLLGGMQGDEITRLEKLGEYLGLIFQLKDDELGLFGKQTDFGKPIGSDIEKEKKTLFYLYLFQQADKEEKKILGELFGSADIKIESVEYIRSLIIKYNILNTINEKIEFYKKSAEDIIDKMNINNKYKKMLGQIIRYNLYRIK